MWLSFANDDINILKSGLFVIGTTHKANFISLKKPENTTSNEPTLEALWVLLFSTTLADRTDSMTVARATTPNVDPLLSPYLTLYKGAPL